MFGKRSTASDLLLDRPAKPAEVAVAAEGRAAPPPRRPRPRAGRRAAAVRRGRARPTNITT